MTIDIISADLLWRLWQTKTSSSPAAWSTTMVGGGAPVPVHVSTIVLPQVAGEEYVTICHKWHKHISTDDANSHCSAI